MAGMVFFSVSMSLDGFIAPERRMSDADVQRSTAPWNGVAAVDIPEVVLPG